MPGQSLPSFVSFRRIFRAFSLRPSIIGRKPRLLPSCQFGNWTISWPVVISGLAPSRSLEHPLPWWRLIIFRFALPFSFGQWPICSRPVPVAPDRHAVPPPAMDARCRPLFLMPKRSGGIPPGDVRVFSQQASKHRRSAVVFPPAIQPSGDGLPP